MAKDPVCGMEVDEKKAAATSVHQGITYYFCAKACKATRISWGCTEGTTSQRAENSRDL